MRCPDCGEALREVSLSGADRSYRCFRCGGFWLEGGLVNKLESGQLGRWSVVKVDPVWLGTGTNSCPVDQTRLVNFRGESVPVSLTVKRCERCGRWWFPTDSLFVYKPAQEAKINYFKMWGMTADVATLLLPTLGLVVAILGTVVGVRYLQVKQEVEARAAAIVNEFSATYLGEGVVLVGFRSTAVLDKLEYRKMGEEKWQMAAVPGQDEVRLVRLTGLTEGAEYEVKISSRNFGFRAASQ